MRDAEEHRESLSQRFVPDGPTRWLFGLATLDLAALALSEVADALAAQGAGGLRGGLLETSSALAIAAAVVAAVALLPVIAHGFFGAGWSSPRLGRMSGRVAPAGLWAALSILTAASICLLLVALS